MNLILATGNARKAEEVAAILAHSNIRLLTTSQLGVKGAGAEDGSMLEQNALSKAWYAYARVPEGNWVAADDTGLFIPALLGQPGVHSARWAGEGATTGDTMRYCLERMRGQRDRSALFRTVVAAIEPDGTAHIFQGRLKGHLLQEPRVLPVANMPYAALFVPEGEELSLAEMTIEHENALSHRGQAFSKLRQFLEHHVP